MKKTLFFVCLILIVLCASITAGAQSLYYNDSYHYYDAGEIGLKINGKNVDGLPMSPVIIDDYTMVPVREVFEALGSEVIWHDDTCQVEIKDGATSVFVKIGDRNTYINNDLVRIKEPQPLPMLIGTEPSMLKSMVPVRFVAENLGYKVEWDNATRTVLISDGGGSADLIIGSTESGKKPSAVAPSGEFVIPETKGVFGSVSAESDSKYDYVYIGTRYGVSPVVTRYSNPERIVFDFPGSQFQSNGSSITLNGNSVASVRYSNNDSKARVVLDITSSTQAMVLSSDKGILIRTEKSENDEIIYDAFAKKVYFNKAYAGNGKAITNGYKVTFTNLKLSTQKIEIHDSFIYEIIIESNSSGCTVAVDGSNKFTYTAEKGFYKSDSTQTQTQTQKPIVNTSGKKLVVIDAGHGGNDPGAVGYDKNGKAVAYESHINLAIALLVGQKLESNGIEVMYTRDKDEYISLQERSDLANQTECTFFVSIHCNAIDKAEISGTQVYYHPVSETGTVLAENIYDEIVDRTNLAPKHTQNGSHLFVIRTTVPPAVLVETAFISNESDRNYLMSSKGQEELAESICRGILKTLK